MTDSPRLLGGRYEVGELIGRGGMAEVHLGHDTRLGRPVAIKMLRSDLARDATFLRRFRREAKAAAGLNHHAIVAVYDSGEEEVTETGGASLAIPYIVMEYVDGETLRDVLNAEGHLAPDEAARITQGILSALEYSHSRGIVHRDIKPANVMLTRGGQVKVMDFGIARAMADVGATMTSASAVVGTARYLSPEQAKGDTVDERSDLYSAGCVFYELLCGRTPFVGEPVSLVYQHITDVPAPPSSYEPSVPKPMDAVAMHALTKPRDERYQNAADFRSDLQAARTGEPVSAAALASLAAAGGAAAAASRAAQPAPEPPRRRDSTREIDERERGKSRAALWVAAALAALIAIFGIGYLVASQPDNPKQVSVPRVVGTTRESAESTLSQRGLTPQVREVASDQQRGIVVRQDPDPGVEVDQNSVVTIDVSAGPNSKDLPSVLDKTEAEARSILNAAGFKNIKVDPTRVDNTQYKEGRVAATVPNGNTAQKPNTEITLKFSSGKVQVPSNLVGMQSGEAYAALGTAYLKASTENRFVTDPDNVGKVLEVKPAGGTKVDVDSTVVLVVGQLANQTVTSTSTVVPPTTSSTSSSSSTTSSSSTSKPSSPDVTPPSTGSPTTPPPPN